MKTILFSLFFLFVLSFIVDEINAQQTPEFVTSIFDDVNNIRTNPQPNTNGLSKCL